MVEQTGVGHRRTAARDAWQLPTDLPTTRRRGRRAWPGAAEAGTQRQGRPVGSPVGADRGVTLVETMVAMFILALLITATVPFLISALRSTSALGGKQTALSVASQQLEYARSVNPSNLVTGRNASDVAALIASPGLVNLSGDVTASGNSDGQAAVGSASAVVPLTVTRTANGTTFTVRTYIDVCYLSKTSGSCTASSLNGPAAYRVSVDVAWPVKQGLACASGRTGYCEYVSTTLVDASDDPVFNVNAPPSVSAMYQVSGGTSSPLSSLHPGQKVTMELDGSNFVYGATVGSGSSDTVGAVTMNTGSVIQVPFTASTALGTRVISVLNPDATSGSAFLMVVTSAPTITAMTPATVARNTAVTFTVTGSDFYATPTIAAATVQPTVALSGTATIGATTSAVAPTTSAVTVTSTSALTFKATFPSLTAAYTTTGTLTVTNSDGGKATYSYSVNAT